jgi:AraC-like DNA-binding protein
MPKANASRFFGKSPRRSAEWESLVRDAVAWRNRAEEYVDHPDDKDCRLDQDFVRLTGRLIEQCDRHTTIDPTPFGVFADQALAYQYPGVIRRGITTDHMVDTLGTCRVAVERLLALATGEHRGGNRILAGSRTKRGTKATKTRKIDVAITLVVRNPELDDAEIARRAKCSRSYLAKNKEYQNNATMARRAYARQQRHSAYNARTGETEAVDN